MSCLHRCFLEKTAVCKVAIVRPAYIKEAEDRSRWCDVRQRTVSSSWVPLCLFKDILLLCWCWDAGHCVSGDSSVKWTMLTDGWYPLSHLKRVLEHPVGYIQGRVVYSHVFMFCLFLSSYFLLLYTPFVSLTLFVCLLHGSLFLFIYSFLYFLFRLYPFVIISLFI
jgi:hypothetical protein